MEARTAAQDNPIEAADHGCTRRSPDPPTAVAPAGSSAGVSCRPRLHFASGASPPAAWRRKVTTSDRAKAFPSGPLISTTTE